MPVFQCPDCGNALSVPDDWAGRVIKCPRCDGKFRVPVIDEMESAAVAQRPATAAVSIAADESPHPEAAANDVSPNDHAQKSSGGGTPFHWLSVLDFKFERHLTPWILRFSWVCVLLLAVVWLLFLGYQFVANSFFSPQPTVATMPTTAAGVNGMLDELLSTASRQQTAISVFSSFPWRALLFVTSLVAILLTVLWTRLFLEALIVVFNMGRSLKSIDDKLK